MKNYKGNGTFDKSGKVDYFVELPTENIDNKFEFFEYYDISNKGENGILIYIKRKNEKKSINDTLEKYHHKFDLKKTKINPFGDSEHFDLNKKDALVVIVHDININLKEVEEYYNNIKKHIEEARDLNNQRPIGIGTGLIRQPN
ncbi:hypothetical protein ACYE2N_08665 [Flavobacterium sp. MAHUQ-51]|uniref:hypothetical protein n=1 Tax=Flavobacterium sp. GCM10022190 TaxID=3252639 RepID=UPI0036135F08